MPKSDIEWSVHAIGNQPYLEVKLPISSEAARQIAALMCGDAPVEQRMREAVSLALKKDESNG